MASQVTLGLHDVACKAHGGLLNKHDGNKFLYTLVSERLLEYKGTTNNVIKGKIRQQIIDDIHARGGNSLKDARGINGTRYLIKMLTIVSYLAFRISIVVMVALLSNTPY
jgi:hypothetical protein